MQVVVIDDERNSIEYLTELLKKKGEFTLAAAFTDSREGLAYLLKNPCDLLFLDIDMPGINGMYIAEQITSLHPQTKICFATAYNGYAAKAFELNAVDYLLKPYTEERFFKCLHKLKNAAAGQGIYQEISGQYEYNLDMICGFNEEDIVLIPAADIFYIEALQGTCMIHTRDHVFRGNKTLNFYEEKLKKNSFFRTHKCYLANLARADRFRPRINYTYDMYFKDIPDVILVSRNKVKELKQYFN